MRQIPDALLRMEVLKMSGRSNVIFSFLRTDFGGPYHANLTAIFIPSF